MPTSAPGFFPDVQAIVRDLLKKRPEVAEAYVDDAPPDGFDGTQLAVLVSRMGGAWVDDLHVDQPLIQLEVYGPTKSQAHALANAARATLLAATGTVFGTSFIGEVTEEDGPRWLPDYIYAGANRYVCILRMAVRTD
ncbi:MULTISPECIES: hypothetical protein [unclassified Streptomyces]|uniref:Tail terminator n=1 Tax=Streptomyces evansiae TaxID=3075535 RepID=A0ABD5ECV8_9ACTN|nr:MULTISPECIES: hypothetical protein [unclassified Streptomyces]EGJ76190.1 hypothetical protein STTU_3401 [Streptomyces sp. Tu6071]MDT0418916.1 hypothetical protein [Streptomyces sp. DSM 41982]MYR25118.1 hypothetical protein [Streptomyces sp. SID4945]SCD41916.1 hypothetical protein GA0115251_107036 [Streptomyces sp. TverLS-915]SCE74437.1 hypothetical protein GA0115257_10176 [Streptomyces sp. LcepLS]